MPIYKSIDNFLVNYPNETDFWEIVNKNLTEKVLDENPVLTDISIKLEVLPTDRLPYDRTSTVFPSRYGQLKEEGNFSLKDYAINHQGLNQINIDIGYQYKPEITPNEYPDFLPIYNSVDNFLTNYPNEKDFWEVVNKNLTQNILMKILSWRQLILILMFCQAQTCPTTAPAKLLALNPAILKELSSLAIAVGIMYFGLTAIPAIF